MFFFSSVHNPAKRRKWKVLQTKTKIFLFHKNVLWKDNAEPTWINSAKLSLSQGSIVNSGDLLQSSVHNIETPVMNRRCRIVLSEFLYPQYIFTLLKALFEKGINVFIVLSFVWKVLISSGLCLISHYWGHKSYEQKQYFEVTIWSNHWFFVKSFVWGWEINSSSLS